MVTTSDLAEKYAMKDDTSDWFKTGFSERNYKESCFKWYVAT